MILICVCVCLKFDKLITGTTTWSELVVTLKRIITGDFVSPCRDTTWRSNYSYLSVYTTCDPLQLGRILRFFKAAQHPQLQVQEMTRVISLLSLSTALSLDARHAQCYGKIVVITQKRASLWYTWRCNYLADYGEKQKTTQASLRI